MTAEPSDEYTAAALLRAELSCVATQEGANTGLWPGLTSYRFTAPTRAPWAELDGLALVVVARGREAVLHGNGWCGEVLDASPQRPCLCLVLQLDPAVVGRVWTELPRATVTPPPTQVSTVALDDELADVVVRFLRSLCEHGDRRVLTPLYLHELVYRLLQRDRPVRVGQLGSRAACDVAAAPAYIDAHLAEPLTVAVLARHVSLSPSAFTRAFRDLTGSPPYQYVKRRRLERARELLVSQRITVADAGRTVGFESTSHFIKAFRTAFGSTPGSYSALGRRTGARSPSSGSGCGHRAAQP